MTCLRDLEELFDNIHSGLATLAVQIFEIIGSSVALERAFSTMNDDT